MVGPSKDEMSRIAAFLELTEEDYKNLPQTDYIMNNTFWVGVHPSLGEKELDKISLEIHKFFKRN